eukprot:6190424-Pleurochrysis_carterae.AAC.1
MRQAWQALTPYSHAPAIYCRASPLVLQLTVATNTVVRNRPATPLAHDYTVRTEAESLLDHVATMR